MNIADSDKSYRLNIIWLVLYHNGDVLYVLQSFDPMILTVKCSSVAFMVLSNPFLITLISALGNSDDDN